MKKILMIFEDSLENNSNGAINSLKKCLEYVPVDYCVDITNIGKLKKKYDRVNVIEVTETRKISFIKKVFMSMTFNGYKCNKELKCVIKKLINKEEYDHVVVTSSYANRYYFNDLKKSESSLILTDLPSIAFKEYLTNITGFLNKVYYLKEMLWCKYYERQLVRRYKNIILVNDKEVDYANQKYSTSQFVHVPVVYDTPDKIVECKKQGDIVNLLFIGNMSFRPNNDGLVSFYNQVFCDLPGCYRLHLVGRDSEKYFTQDKRVIGHGFVDDMSALMEDIHFGICYMVNGGGMKNKVFDYMRYGIPCIVNEYVMKNNTVDSEYIYVANDSKEFINIIEKSIIEPLKIIDSIKKYNVCNVAPDFWNLFGV